MVQIPEGEECYDFLFVENENSSLPKYKLLNDLVRQRPKSKEERAIGACDNLISTLSELYPNKKTKLQLLRPLIIRKILKGESLGESYYEALLG